MLPDSDVKISGCGAFPPRPSVIKLSWRETYRFGIGPSSLFAVPVKGLLRRMSLLFELRQVTHFYGKVRALINVDLAVEPGAIGLVGQNGAGKSTLLQILLGLIRQTQGSAVVLGHEVRSAGLQLRSRIGYMPERSALIPGLNGIEYVALAGELCGMPRKQALRRAHEMLSDLGLEDARYRKLEQYSLGMVQRLKLAATLVHDPDLLLLDEPTSGLDPEGRTDMLRLLESLAARPGKSLLLATHLLGDIERVCRSAIILKQGQVLSVGLIDQLRRQRPRTFRLCWEGESASFMAGLKSQGVTVNSTDQMNRIQVIVPPDWATRNFFVEAQRQSVQITRLEPDEEDLQAVYQRMVGLSSPLANPAEARP
jgi:ABC-2 type transport system ATP-binding protein